MKWGLSSLGAPWPNDQADIETEVMFSYPLTLQCYVPEWSNRVRNAFWPQIPKKIEPKYHLFPNTTLRLKHSMDGTGRTTRSSQKQLVNHKHNEKSTIIPFIEFVIVQIYKKKALSLSQQDNYCAVENIFRTCPIHPRPQEIPELSHEHTGSNSFSTVPV